MKVMSRFLLLLLIPLLVFSGKVKGQASIVSDPGLYLLIEGLQATMGGMSGAQQAAEGKKQAQKVEEMTKLAKSAQVFAQNAEQARKTIQILNTLICLLDEINTLQKLRKSYGFQTCYASVEFDIFQVRLTSQMSVMKGLFEEAFETTGQKKNMDWSQINDNLAVLKNDMLDEKQKLSSDVRTLKGKDIMMEEQTSKAVNTWRMVGGIGR